MPELRNSNRLIEQKSPYLLQHAHNPVDWYPWSDEAFEKAKRKDKPIFLSIGIPPVTGAVVKVPKWHEGLIFCWAPSYGVQLLMQRFRATGGKSSEAYFFLFVLGSKYLVLCSQALDFSHFLEWLWFSTLVDETVHTLFLILAYPAIYLLVGYSIFLDCYTIVLTIGYAAADNFNPLI
jgi:hypothetical protein